MKLFQILFFSLLTLSLSAQKKKEVFERDANGNVKSDSTSMFIPNIVCIESDGPFITWRIQPESFSFLLYDRWGNVLGKTDKYDFDFDEILSSKEMIPLKEGIYYYHLIYSLSNGIKKEFSGHITSTGWYCRCG